MTTITKERLHQVINGDILFTEEQREMARMLLAVMDDTQEPVAHAERAELQQCRKEIELLKEQVQWHESGSRQFRQQFEAAVAELDEYRKAQPVQVDNTFIPKNLDRALGVVGVALPESKEEFYLQTERWIQRLIDRVIRYSDEFKAQPAPVVPCPFPCGWDNLNKYAIQDASFVAQGLVEGEVVTESHRQAVIANNDRLLKVITACRAAMLNHSEGDNYKVESRRSNSPIIPINLNQHVYRELVNQLRDTAVKYAGCQQLREQISRTLQYSLVAGNSASVSDIYAVARAALDYIDALPLEIVSTLPTMPGFDRDWANEVMARAISLTAKNTRNLK